MSSLKPLADRVLVKPDEAEQKTASGLYIASNAQEKPQRGTIVAVGAGKVNDKGERIPMDVQVGDEVEANQTLAVIEAMKMETAITARTAGTVKTVRVKEGQPVKAKELLMVLE